MPLLDHFHAPLSEWHQWGSFFSNWSTRIADQLVERVPAEFLASEHPRASPRVGLDITTYEPPPTWVPPPRTMPSLAPDSFEVRAFSTLEGRNLAGVILLVSPNNKEGTDERRAFAAKCVTHLYRGVSAIVIDIVTSRRGNLHNETMRLMDAEERLFLPDNVSLYAVAYRPVQRDERPEIDFWPAPLAVGTALPVLPLRLTGDLFVPVDFEATYQEACRRRHLA